MVNAEVIDARSIKKAFEAAAEEGEHKEEDLLQNEFHGVYRERRAEFLRYSENNKHSLLFERMMNLFRDAVNYTRYLINPSMEKRARFLGEALADFFVAVEFGIASPSVKWMWMRFQSDYLQSVKDHVYHIHINIKDSRLIDLKYVRERIYAIEKENRKSLNRGQQEVIIWIAHQFY